ncbi:MAG TPA: acyltransferase [Planctomycetota bacterium]|nr:acyltransferase [Planctomycetota bacterium]
MSKLDGQQLAPPRIHPTALIEAGVVIGDGSSVWDNVHIRHGARIGRKCIIGEKTYIAYDVQIGDLCKLNACVYVCAQVKIAEGVMISAHTVFTNDRFPRACDPELEDLLGSDPNAETLWCTVQRGVTIGANATIGPGLTIGEFAMVGMSSVVTRSVPPHGLVIGSPARLSGLVCRCGEPVLKLGREQQQPAPGSYPCHRCSRKVSWPQPGR